VNLSFFQASEWLILPESLQAMVATAESAFGRAIELRPPRTDPLLSVDNGIGTIDITGPIMRNPDLIATVLMGATDSNRIAAAIEEAAHRPDIKAVFLNIDSPGGTVLGTPELAAAVSALNENKPVYAFTSGLMASAAYWIGSQASAVYATPSARVGSIGVVQTVLDQTARLGAMGVKVEVFSVGKFKAMGTPGTSLNDTQREHIMANLAEIADDFHTAVLAKRRAIPADAMEGQTFSGKQAERFNIAGMVPDRAEAMRRLRVYQAAVDTKSRVMNAPEDILAQTKAQLEALQRDHQAQTELLNEATADADSLRGQTAILAAEVETLKAERDTAIGNATALQTRVTTLQESQADFDTRVQTEVARVVASTGTTLPARVTPAGDQPQAAELHAQFAAITDPAAQTVFWRKLTPEQQALILKHQA
jgi:signal peptide peptidase SppA